MATTTTDPNQYLREEDTVSLPRLKTILDAMECDELLAQIRKSGSSGPLPDSALLRAYFAMEVLNISFHRDLAECLRCNELFRTICGFKDKAPLTTGITRFVTSLEANHRESLTVCMNELSSLTEFIAWENGEREEPARAPTPPLAVTPSQSLGPDEMEREKESEEVDGDPDEPDSGPEQSPKPPEPEPAEIVYSGAPGTPELVYEAPEKVPATPQHDPLETSAMEWLGKRNVQLDREIQERLEEQDHIILVLRGIEERRKTV